MYRVCHPLTLLLLTKLTLPVYACVRASCMPFVDAGAACIKVLVGRLEPSICGRLRVDFGADTCIQALAARRPMGIRR